MELTKEEKIEITRSALRSILVQEYQNELNMIVNTVPEHIEGIIKKGKNLGEAKEKLSQKLRELEENKE